MSHRTENFNRLKGDIDQNLSSPSDTFQASVMQHLSCHGYRHGYDYGDDEERIRTR